MPPRTAIAAATEKTAIAICPPRLRGGTRRIRGVGLVLLVLPRLHFRRPWLQQLLLGVNELLPARVRQLVFGPEHDRLHRTRLFAVAAEDAAEHVDLVGLGVPLARGYAILVGVLRCDHEDAADRTGGGAKLARDAALEGGVVAAEVGRLAMGLLTGR